MAWKLQFAFSDNLLSINIKIQYDYSNLYSVGLHNMLPTGGFTTPMFFTTT